MPLSFSCFLYDNIDGRCNCTAGFDRHPEGYCADIDECSSGENDCVPEAKCVDMPGDYRVRNYCYPLDTAFFFGSC